MPGNVLLSSRGLVFSTSRAFPFEATTPSLSCLPFLHSLSFLSIQYGFQDPLLSTPTCFTSHPHRMFICVTSAFVHVVPGLVRYTCASSCVAVALIHFRSFELRLHLCAGGRSAIPSSTWRTCCRTYLGPSGCPCLGAVPLLLGSIM